MVASMVNRRKPNAMLSAMRSSRRAESKCCGFGTDACDGRKKSCATQFGKPCRNEHRIPLTLTLSLGERESVSRDHLNVVRSHPISRLMETNTQGSRQHYCRPQPKHRPWLFPLPEGEGQGEGARRTKAL